MAARLDDVLEAAGELAALAEAARAAPDAGPEPRQDSGRQAGEGHAVITEGMSLTLPYVPGRLVIEVSGPAGSTGVLADGGDDREAAPGRLALVGDTHSGLALAEATGG